MQNTNQKMENRPKQPKTQEIEKVLESLFYVSLANEKLNNSLYDLMDEMMNDPNVFIDEMAQQPNVETIEKSHAFDFKKIVEALVCDESSDTGLKTIVGESNTSLDDDTKTIIKRLFRFFA